VSIGKKAEGGKKKRKQMTPSISLACLHMERNKLVQLVREIFFRSFNSDLSQAAHYKTYIVGMLLRLFGLLGTI